MALFFITSMVVKPVEVASMMLGISFTATFFKWNMVVFLLLEVSSNFVVALGEWPMRVGVSPTVIPPWSFPLCFGLSTVIVLDFLAEASVSLLKS